MVMQMSYCDSAAGYSHLRQTFAQAFCTMAIHPSTTTALIVLLPLLAWRLHARYKRLIGRQRTNKYRPWIVMAVYALLLGLIGWAVWGQWIALEALAAGLGAGWLISRWAWKQTQLEPTPQGLYYTPHTHLGIALLVLFIARIAYRVVEVIWLLPESQAGFHAFVASPLTLSVFGLMAGHSSGYALALYLWRRRVLQAKRAREALRS